MGVSPHCTHMCGCLSLAGSEGVIVCSQKLASLAGWEEGSGERPRGWALPVLNDRASDTARPQAAAGAQMSQPMRLPTIHLRGWWRWGHCGQGPWGALVGVGQGSDVRVCGGGAGSIESCQVLVPSGLAHLTPGGGWSHANTPVPRKPVLWGLCETAQRRPRAA